MANLASSALVENEYWREGLNNRFTAKDVTLTLTGQGGTTNLIPAAVFGLSQIRDVRSAVDSNNKPLRAVPSYDRASIVLTPQSATVVVYNHAGVNGAGTITLTGIATTDEIVSVLDLTTPGVKTTSQYTITAANTVTQAAGAGDTSAKTLQFTTRSPASGTPADFTGTVRLIVVGKE